MGAGAGLLSTRGRGAHCRRPASPPPATVPERHRDMNCDRLAVSRDRGPRCHAADLTLIVRSAYRSPEHNRTVGGARASKHLEGIAFDVAMANHELLGGVRGSGAHPGFEPYKEWASTRVCDSHRRQRRAQQLGLAPLGRWIMRLTARLTRPSVVNPVDKERRAPRAAPSLAGLSPSLFRAGNVEVTTDPNRMPCQVPPVASAAARGGTKCVCVSMIGARKILAHSSLRPPLYAASAGAVASARPLVFGRVVRVQAKAQSASNAGNPTSE